MALEGLKRHWMRVSIIVLMFIGAGVLPTFIETQVIPMAQIFSLFDDYVDPDSPVFLNFDEVFGNLDEMKYIDALSDDKQTTIEIEMNMENKASNYYPMKFPILDIDMYYKAGRPFRRDSNIVYEFKHSDQFLNVSEIYASRNSELDYDYYTWVRVLGLSTAEEVIIWPGDNKLVKLTLTLYTNGEIEGNALSQMIGTLIRTQTIKKDTYWIKGNLLVGGIPVPLDLDPITITGEIDLGDLGGGGGGGTSSLFSMIGPLMGTLLDDVPTSLISGFLGDMGRFINLADIRNYNDTNDNGYRDWDDANIDGLKGANEAFTEPLLENGTFFGAIFLKLKDFLAVQGLDLSFPKSTWNIEEGQNSSDSLGRPLFNDHGTDAIGTTVWGSSTQQLLLYLPDEAAVAYNKSNWKNRVLATIGFPDATIAMDNVIQPHMTIGGNDTIPFFLGTNLKMTGDARANSDFGPGDALGALLEMFLDTEDRGLHLGIMGNVQLMIGQIPLSLSFDLPLSLNMSEDFGSGEPTNDTGGALSTAMDFLGTLTNYFGITDIAFHGAAMDTFNKVLQTNLTLIMDNTEGDGKDGGFFFPYGLYFPTNEQEADNFLSITGGPIQIFNESLPTEWDNRTIWTEPNRLGWFEDHLVANFSIESQSMTESLKHLLIKFGSINNGMGIAYNFKSAATSPQYIIGSYNDVTNGYYSNTRELLLNDWMVNPEERYRTYFEMTIDQLRLDLNDLFPQLGTGFEGMLAAFDLNPTLIDYLNKSLDDWGTSTGRGSGSGGTGTLIDMLTLDPSLFVSILNQPGTQNDLLDFMIDEGLLNETHSKFDFAALVEGIFGLFGDDLAGITGGGSGGEETDLLGLIIEILDASGLNFNELIPILFNFLVEDLSYRYGVKPFELIDVIIGSMGSGGVSSMMSGMDVDYENMVILFDYIKDLVNVIEPFDLIYNTVNDPLPFLDYLNRSGILSEGFLSPLIISMFEGGGGEGGGAPFDLGPIIRNLGDLMYPLLFGEPEIGVQPINLLALLQSAESVTLNSSSILQQYLELLSNVGYGDKTYFSGSGSYLADMPPYYSLRLLENLIYALMQSGLDSEMIYELLALLGILDLSGMQGGIISGPGGGDDILGGMGDIASLISVMGYLAPPGEWISILRELGIWSDWEGDMDLRVTPAYVTIDIFGGIDLSIEGLINSFLSDLALVNLKKFFATGKLELLPGFDPGGGGGGGMSGLFDVPLSLMENQSYGNPYHYVRGYDTSAYDGQNRGPYHEILYDNPDAYDNWGWAPLGWDPGWYSIYNGLTAGDPAKNFTSDVGFEYKTGFLSELISYLPIAIDIDIPEVTVDLTNPPFIDDMLIYTLDLWIFSIDILVTMGLFVYLAMQTSMRIRLEGNVASLVDMLEDEGMSPLGMARHFAGGDLNSLIGDLIADFTTIGSGTGGTPGEPSALDELFDAIFNNIPSYLNAFFTSDIDIYHYLQYLLDPNFLPTQTWYLDSGYQKWDFDIVTWDGRTVTISNPEEVSLFWDVNWNTYDFRTHPDNDGYFPIGYNVTGLPYFGDADDIPDEYPWYRFFRPVYNQINPDRGPGNYLQADLFRYPADRDDLTPTGYPGQGQWTLAADGITDGIQHYWFDTPYSYANASVKSIDPWPNVNPDNWNDVSGLPQNNGQYYYQWGPVWVDTEDLPPGYSAGWYVIQWGEGAPLAKGTVAGGIYHPDRKDFPFEQVPLLQVNGLAMPNQYWEYGVYNYADLYQGWASNPVRTVFQSQVPGNNNFGATVPDNQIIDINSQYPDIWACFDWTLDDFDYRLGSWETTVDPLTGIEWDYLDVKPFDNLLAMGVTPHLPGAIDLFDIPQLIVDLFGGGSVTGGISGDLGNDYYHRTAYNNSYSLFESAWTYVENEAPTEAGNATLVDNNQNSSHLGALTALDEAGMPIWTQYDGNSSDDRTIWQPNKYYGATYGKSDMFSVIFGLLQWIWDGAGTVYKTNDTGDMTFLGGADAGYGRYANRYEVYPSTYLQPFSTPNLTAAVQWLYDRGLSMDYMISYAIPTLMEDLQGLLGSVSDVTSALDTTTVTNIVKAIENYFAYVPGTLDPNTYNDDKYTLVQQNITMNKKRGTEIIFNVITDLMNRLDIHPLKAVSGILEVVMPVVKEMTESDGGSGGGGSSLTDMGTMFATLNNTLWGSGLKEILFTDPIKVLDTVVNLSIQNTTLNLKLMGIDLSDIPISLDLPLNFSELIGGAAEGNTTVGNASMAFEMPSISITDLDLELSTFNGPFTVPFEAWSTDNTFTVSKVPNVEVTYGYVDYDLLTETTFFNVTVYDVASKGITPGWYNDSTTNKPLSYVTDTLDWGLTHTDAQGNLTISGEIVDDSFGWVQPYIYIHVDPMPTDTNWDYYWWNITNTPAQETLAGNTPESQARWIYSGAEIVSRDALFNKIQEGNNVTNINSTHPPARIQGDPLEIFARVEIDNTTMPIHKIHYMERGTIGSLNASHSSAVYGDAYHTFLRDESVREDSHNWTVVAGGGENLADMEQLISPVFSKIIYPLSSEIIDIFEIESENWIDDSLTKALIYYYDINDTVYANPITLLDFDLRNHPLPGETWSDTSTYPNNFVTLDDDPGNNWVTSDALSYDSFVFQSRETIGPGTNYQTARIGDLNLNFDNFNQTALRNLTVRYRVYNSPLDDTTPQWVTAYKYNGEAIDSYQSFMYRDTDHLTVQPTANPSIYGEAYSDLTPIPGSHGTPLFDGRLSDRPTDTWTGCYYGIYNYTYTIPTDAFVSEITYDFHNYDGHETQALHYGGIEVLDIQAYSATSGWVNLYTGPVGVQRVKTLSGSIDRIPADTHRLFLTNRQLNPGEDFDKLQITVRFMDGNYDNGAWVPADSLGWNNSINYTWQPVDVSANLQIKKVYFVDEWDQGNELPTGFISGFDIYAEMYDPLNQLPSQPNSNVSISYNVYQRISGLQDIQTFYSEDLIDLSYSGVGDVFENTDLLASKVHIDFEMEDSIVNDDVKGGRGDVLYEDAVRPFGVLWTPLNDTYRPYTITNVTSFDLETAYEINATVSAGQALKGYYLNMTVGDPRGYVEREITRLTQYVYGNPDLNHKISLFAPKPVITWDNSTGEDFARTYRLGTVVDIDPYVGQFTIQYNLRVRVTPDYIHDWKDGVLGTEPIDLYFSGWWELPESSYEVVTMFLNQPLTEGGLYREIHVD